MGGQQLNEAAVALLRIFLVEDLQTMRGLMEDAFAAVGGLQLVAVAGTEAEARMWLKDHAGDWDIAIVDLVLAQGSGFGVPDACRRAPGRGKVAVFSSYLSPGVRAHCLGLGADAAFEKDDTAGFLRWLREQADLLPEGVQ